MTENNNVLNNLTIVSITFNDEEGLFQTYLSLKRHIKKGLKWIIINGGNRLNNKDVISDCFFLREDKDKGRYDALNIGINLVSTKYFMLVHSGDKLLINPTEILIIMKETKSNLHLGNQTINFSGIKRMHTTKFWHPIMLKLGAQPPHLPIIYETKFAKRINYSLDYPIISDYDYLNKLFDLKPKYIKTNTIIIEMTGGGATSSGLKSFFKVSAEYIKYYGLARGLLVSVIRIPLKFLQML